jgi:hypothetical protein
LLSRGGGWVGCAEDEHVGGVVAEGNAFFFEGDDDAATEFAEDTVSLICSDSDLDGVGDGAAFDLVDAEDDGVGDGDVFEDGVVTDAVGHFTQDGDDLIRIGAGVHADVELGDGEVAGEVGDGGDLAVGDDVEGAVAIAETGAAEGEVFDGAFESGENDDLADVVLVFDEDEDAVEHVFEYGLCAEADADADDSGGGKDGLVGDVEDVEDLKEGDEAKYTDGGGAKDGGHGAELGGAMEVDLMVGPGAHLFDEEEDNTLEDEDNQKDHGDFGQLVLQERDDVVVPVVFDDLNELLLLRGRSQKVHHYCVSLSGKNARNRMRQLLVRCNSDGDARAVTGLIGGLYEIDSYGICGGDFDDRGVWGTEWGADCATADGSASAATRGLSGERA